MKKLCFLFLLLASPLQATTYYVNKAGSNSNSCATAQSSTDANAKLTVSGATGGLSCLSAGDTLEIGAGTYAESISGFTTGAIISGVNDSTRTVVQGESAATIIFTGDINIYSRSFITVRNVIVDNSAGSVNTIRIGRASTADALTTFVTFDTVTARNMGDLGAGGFNVGFRQHGAGNSNILLLNCKAHNNGVGGTDHGVYVQGEGITINGGEFYDNAGHGIHAYSGSGCSHTDNLVIKNARVYENASYGIGLYSGTNLQAYNNLIYGNGTNPSTTTGGMRIGFACGHGAAYNNTVYANEGYGIHVLSTTDNIVRNNISYNNTLDNLRFETSPINSNNVTTNPNFVNTTDFQLNAGPAVDAGACLGSIFTDDFSGVTRSNSGCTVFGEGLFWDVGAQEKLDSSGDTLTLLNPNSGTLGVAGSSQTFTWSSTGTIANVRLRYDNDGIGFGSPTVLSASTPNDGSFAFTAPAAGTTYRFEVCDAADNDPCDFSDSDVIITAAAGGEFTTILSDNTVGSKIGTPGTDDTYIYSVTPTTNYATSTGLFGQSDAHSLVRFTGFSAIDPAATVTSVSFSLWLVNGGTDANGTIALRRLLRNFNESGATWNVYNTGSNWTTAGGLGDATDRVATASASITSVGTTAGQFYTVTDTDCVTSGTLCDDVQKRIDGTYSDLAWHVSKTGGTSFKRFSSSEDTDGQRPALSITYDVTVPTIEVTSPTTGAHYFPGDIVGVRWTSQGLTGNFSAELSLNNGVSYQPTPIIPSHPYDQSDAVWTAEGPACEQCKIRVCQGATCGESAAFKIGGTTLSIR